MKWLPMRIELGILAMLGFINLYMTRINVSVISVAMVKRNISINEESQDNELEKCLQDIPQGN